MTSSAQRERLRQWLRDHHGIIGYHEALDLGLSRDLVRAKLDSGEWVRVYRGVYRHAAAPVSAYQDLRAAYVALRGRGTVSHLSAAWLWDLVATAPVPPELSVGHAAGEALRPRGPTVHRSKDLHLSRPSFNHGFRVTNPMRTIVDVAAAVPPAQLTAIVDTSLASRLVTVAGLTAELARLARPGRPGVRTLRLQLRDRGFIGAPAPSVLESKMLRLLIAAHLPVPRVEHHVGDDGEYRLDFAWDEICFSVEVDGYVWHFSPEHQQRDHRRRAQLQDLGWTVRVYTWRDVCDEPARVAREIVAMYNRLSQQYSKPA